MEGESSDPAAEFLAREKDELGELGEELGIGENPAAPANEETDGTNAEVKEANLGADVPQTVQEEAALVDQMGEMRMNSTPSPAFVMPPRPKEEPETIKQWRIDQAKRLEEKDAEEASKKTELQEKAKQELAEWYKRYDENLNKTKVTNRESEKEFVAEVNDISPGTEWERVAKLCDFSGKNPNKNSGKDMSRMRSILLQLKQQQGPSKNAN